MNPESVSSNEKILYYIHDPMCSWCWAFRPTWEKIAASLGPHIKIKYVLGGLAPDTDQPMPEAMQFKIRSIWQTIQSHVPGTEFNFDFWKKANPRRSTYPACRAVIAAGFQGNEYEYAMISAIQKAYYTSAKNPSDVSVLTELAAVLGLDVEQFTRDLNASQTQDKLREQISFGQQIGARGFPSLILKHGGGYRRVDFDYVDPDVVLKQLV